MEAIINTAVDVILGLAASENAYGGGFETGPGTPQTYSSAT